MPRLTITLPDSLYNRLSSLAVQHDNSMSSIINHLIGIGMSHLGREPQQPANSERPVVQHCHQLVIQMNALIKNLSAEILKFNQDDFEKLRQAAEGKYNELSVN